MSTFIVNQPPSGHDVADIAKVTAQVRLEPPVVHKAVEPGLGTRHDARQVDAFAYREPGRVLPEAVAGSLADTIHIAPPLDDIEVNLVHTLLAHGPRAFEEPHDDDFLDLPHHRLVSV